MNPVSPLQDRRYFAMSVMLAINLYFGLSLSRLSSSARKGASSGRRLE